MSDIQSSTAAPKKVAVIGAGITGMTTAYQLHKRGCEVTVFDRARYAAMETSFANGGQLSTSNAEVWNSWATVAKGLRWMLNSSAPLLVNPKPSWHKISWMLEFVNNISGYRDNTLKTVDLALKARDVLLEMADEANIDFNVEKRGILHFYKNKKDYDHAAEVSKIYAEGGLSRDAVTVEEMKQIEPTLSGAIYGGFYTESDFTGDIHKYTNGLADYCGKNGVTMRFETDVTGFDHLVDGVRVSYAQDGESHTDQFHKIVVCAGVHSRKLASMLGDRVNIYPVKGYSITVNLPSEADQAAAPWVSLLDDDAKVVTSRLGKDRFRVAGTAEFNGFNKNIRMDRIDPLVGWCNEFFPEMSTRNVVPWAGLRPMLPDMLPRVGPGKNPNVLYNTGHGHLGWTLSAITAHMIAEMA